MKQTHHMFSTFLDFWIWFSTQEGVTDKFDLKSTASLPDLQYIFNGERKCHVCLQDLLEDLKSTFGVPFLVKPSFTFGRSCTVYLSPETSELQPDLVEEIVAEATEKEVLPEAEEPTEEGSGLSVELDWEMINNLKNTKYDKIKLEEHVLEVTGGKINLKRNKTLENMIKSLKEQL